MNKHDASNLEVQKWMNDNFREWVGKEISK